LFLTHDGFYDDESLKRHLHSYLLLVTLVTLVTLATLATVFLMMKKKLMNPMNRMRVFLNAVLVVL
jgi:hypothetical protein